MKIKEKIQEKERGMEFTQISSKFSLPKRKTKRTDKKANGH